ncbi:hypothetical protein Poli38472_014136 [Pythium oligandrum]|uniref:BAR domain-containing protein n=1 Tax=Pythium oligandrum TaxID=41045 RepID=A0A8K1FKB7_PYTOL|nr:hypothetical protein Poli38472_014136 [Pythium oligandrum]|eukprot:TMW64019.1 hypothetical protein Poli38472_014136 [Pythium oligandrum]
MSSLRLLNKIGAAKPSKNVQFDMAYENFERTHSSVQALDAALRGFLVSMKAFHVSAQVLYGAIEAMGGTTENSPEMKSTVNELKNAFMKVDVQVLNEAAQRFEQRVMRPSSGWAGCAAILKQQVATYEEEKLAYDHYTRKVMSLRETRNKHAGVGKAEKPKDVEKLVRNEQKLASATNSYVKTSEVTITKLREFVNKREETLTPLLHRLLEFRASYANQVAEESKLMANLVPHDSATDGVLSMLDRFVANFTGHGGGGNAGSATETAPTQHREPEQPVKALSFETFTGEAPPKVVETADDWTPAPLDMPPMPSSRSASLSIPPPPPPQLTLSSPTSSLSFMEQFTPSAPTSPYFTAPVQQYSPHAPPPPPPQSAFSVPLPLSPSSTSAGSTPWDDMPAQMSSSLAQSFNTAPVQPYSPHQPPPPPPPSALSLPLPLSPPTNSFTKGQQNAMTSPSASDGWESFAALGSSADFQNLHHSAMH